MEKLDKIIIISSILLTCSVAYKWGYDSGIDYANKKHEINEIKFKQFDANNEMRSTINHILYLDSIKNHDLIQLLNEKR